MRNLLFVFALIMAIVFAGCSKSDDAPEPSPNPNPEYSIIVNPSDTLHNIDSKTQELIVVVSSNIDIDISIPSDIDWITCAQTKTATDKSFTFTIKENKTHNKRSAIIVFKNTETPSSDTITINQAQLNAIIIGEESKIRNIDSEVQELTIAVSSNIDVEISIPGDVTWITHTKSKAMTSKSFVLAIAKNDTHEKRTAKVVFKNTATNIADTITVNQAQLNAIVITQAVHNLGSELQTLPITVSSNIDIEVSIPTDATWITYVATKAMSDKTFNLSIAKNGTTERTAKVVFKNTSTNLADTITVNQAQLNAIVISKKEYSVGSSAQDLSITVSSNIDIEVDIPNGIDWVALAAATRSMSDKSYTFQILANNDNSNRSVEIIFKNTKTNISEIVMISQSKQLHLVDFDGSYIPNGDLWVIADYETTTASFNGIKKAILSLEKSNRKISLEFPNIINIPNEALGGYEFINNVIEFMSFPKATTIGRGAFNDCNALTTISLPKCTTIGDNAFSSCDKLALCSLPKAVTIGRSVFSSCYELASVSFPEATTIGDDAFYFCRDLTSISLPKVQIIGDNAFNKCISLTSLSFPEAITIGQYIMGTNNANDVFETPNPNTTLMSISLPKAINIKDNAFYRCEGLISILTPKVQIIGDNAFDRCHNLASVSFPEATTIGDDAFSWSRNLSSVSLPKAQIIGKSAFESCKLTSISLPEALTIGSYAFQDINWNTTLISVFLPKVTTIGRAAFNGCSALASISLPEVTVINDYTFSGCMAIKSFSLPKASEVGKYAFSQCKTLASILMPKVTTIENNAFDGCIALSFASFPSVLSIGASAFKYCDALVSLDLATNNGTKIKYLYNNIFILSTTSTQNGKITLSIGSANSQNISGNTLTVNGKSYAFKRIIQE